MTQPDGPVLDNSSSPFMQMFETGWLLTAVGLVASHVGRFSQDPEIALWPALLLVILGLPTADFLSGLTHWAGDTWGKVTTRWIGPRFLVPFRFHHLYPQHMLRSTFVTTNGDAALVSCLLLGFAWLIPVDSLGLVAVFVAATGMWGMATSQIHKWAHDPHPPRLVQRLQRMGVILRPEHHWRHHCPPFASHYCITTGWCNPVLERMRFWRSLERLVSRLSSLKPRCDVDAE